jgi:hypothetical protein
MFGSLLSTKKKTAPPTTGSSSGPSSDSLSDPLGDSLGSASAIPKATSKAASDKVLKPGFFDKLFKTQKSKDWDESQLSMARTRIRNDWTFIEKYWSELFDFAVTEHSPENMEMYEAIQGGVNPRSLYQRWISTSAPDEVNLPGAKTLHLHQLAAEDRYDEMDFKPLLMDVRMNIIDTSSRFSYTDAFGEAFKKRGM